MAFTGTTFGGSNNTTPNLGSSGLYNVSDFGKNVVTNKVTAGQTFSLKQLLAVTTKDTDSTLLPTPKAGAGNVSQISNAWFTQQSALVNDSGELVYTFKAASSKTSSTAQLPGIAINFAFGAGDLGPGNAGPSRTTIYLFQIA